METRTRHYIVTLLREEGFFYIEERLLCYLETFVTEIIARLALTLEAVGYFLRAWLRSIMQCAIQAEYHDAVFLRLVVREDEIYFTLSTRDARLLCTYSGDSLVETIALAILATPVIPCE